MQQLFLFPRLLLPSKTHKVYRTKSGYLRTLECKLSTNECSSSDWLWPPGWFSYTQRSAFTRKHHASLPVVKPRNMYIKINNYYYCTTILAAYQFRQIIPRYYMAWYGMVRNWKFLTKGRKDILMKIPQKLSLHLFIALFGMTRFCVVGEHIFASVNYVINTRLIPQCQKVCVPSSEVFSN